jgi:HD-GYP domain-containing protein (c-di-GMP phosphodiesterase class II)
MISKEKLEILDSIVIKGGAYTEEEIEIMKEAVKRGIHAISLYNKRLVSGGPQRIKRFMSSLKEVKKND